VSVLRIALIVVAGAAVLVGLSHGLPAAERRGWIRLHGTGKGSAAVGFAAMQDIFTPGRNEARQMQEEQKRVGNRAPTPGDGLDDGPEFTGRYGGRLTIPVPDSHRATTTTSDGMSSGFRKTP
jgi:hypothetical protein